MKVLYIHIPKTGGTSITSALSKCDSEVITERHPIYKYDRLYGKQIQNVLDFKLPRSEHFKEVLGNALYDRLWKVAMVRNPWDRYVSNWKWLTRDACKYNNYTKNENSFTTFETFVKESQRCFGSNLIRPYDHQRWHLRNQTEHIVDVNGEIMVDYVGRFENIQEDFNKICEKAGVTLELPYLNRVGHYSGEEEKSKPTKTHYSTYYTQELVDIIAERCKPDIEYFKYDYKEENK